MVPVVKVQLGVGEATEMIKAWNEVAYTGQ